MSKWVNCEVDDGKINSRCPKCNSPIRLVPNGDNKIKHDCETSKKNSNYMAERVTETCRKFKEETRRTKNETN